MRFFFEAVGGRPYPEPVGEVTIELVEPRDDRPACAWMLLRVCACVRVRAGWVQREWVPGMSGMR